MDSRHGETPEDSRHGETPMDSRHGETPEDSRHGETPEDSRHGETPEDCRPSPDSTRAWPEGDGAEEPPRPPDSTKHDSDEPHRPPNSSTACDAAEPNSLEDDTDEPRRPLDSDCCGSGCSPCVFDLYDRDLAAWRRRREQRRALGSAQPSAATTSPLRPDRFTALRLASITAVSDTASLYRFLLPPGACLRLPPAAHLRLRATDAAGRVLARAYTPVSPPQAEGFFEVYVRRYAAGAMSACVRLWQPGQLALWSGPFGGFRRRPGDTRLVLLAAGTGVAPFVALLRAALDDEEGDTRLTLLLAARRLQDVFPRRELTQWARYWNFTYRLFVSGPEEETAAAWYGEPVCWRRLEREDVQQVVQQPAAGTSYLVCGTRSFEKDVLNHLRVAGVEDEDVFRF